MIILAFLGFMDFFAAIIILLFHYHIIDARPFIAFIIYLIAKGVMFLTMTGRGGLATFLDFVIAMCMIAMLFTSMTTLTWIIIIYLIQKAVVSFLH